MFNRADRLCKQGSIGIPIAGVEMRILDELGAPAPAGTVGEIVDRKKDMIIRGGFNVYPRELEEVLHHEACHPGARDEVSFETEHAAFARCGARRS